MSPLQVLVLPDALRSPNQGRIRPGCPVVGSRTASGRSDGNSLFFLFFISFTTVAHLLEISPSQPPPPAYLYLILYPLCTLSLSVSLSTAPSLIPSHPRRLSISLPLQSLSRSLPSPLWRTALSLSSAHSLPHPLYLPRALSLHLDCRSSSLSVPLSSPLIPTHSVFIRLCSLSQFG